MGKRIAIITARGGSKRIPRKNIRCFLGQPVLKYLISAALESRCFDEVMVSTDDAEIKEIALSSGAQVPFLRSKIASGDFAATADVIEEVLSEYAKRGDIFEYCCCIYPTAPFMTPENLKKGLEIIKKENANSVFPIVCFTYPIQRALKIEGNRVSMIWPENMNMRSQDLVPAYHDAGQFYWLRVKSFFKEKRLFSENSSFFEIPESEAHDIDSEEDWKIAERKHRILKSC